ncbi:zinc finger protein 276 isoform X2 [Piliocolobus tephrosceles]|uniref:zinc finger protein 276 isoform X2 n=1 Tax=Piliocolobus tephrosceles TaxID=591936 RepID=UPI000C2AFE0F|nr:zinc finger protein 276 isoform X2 [Piliocolobus tephrosceles]
MKRDRLGRFLSPGAARQRGASGGGGGGRARGRPSLSGGSRVDGATARRPWGPVGHCGDAGEDGVDEAGAGRALAMGHCRLCHGKFSSRSLRSISERAPGASMERPSAEERVLVRDFQRLLGVAVRQDPTLSQFVCKSCHAQFYQCHSLLRSFLQRVNVSPTGRRKPCAKVGAQPPTGAEEGACLAPSACTAWWDGCTDMRPAAGPCPTFRGHCPLSTAASSRLCGAATRATTTPWTPAPAAKPSCWTVRWRSSGHGTRRRRHGCPSTEGGTLGMPLRPPRVKGQGPQLGLRPRFCPAQMRPGLLRTATRWGPGRASHLSRACPSAGPQGSWVRSRSHLQPRMIGDVLSDDENDKKQNTQSSDESFEPYPERKVSGKKSESKEAKKSEEPRIRKKPGPKPGWKKQLRCEREELPTIYKCPYQGCTAVYRGADGMKKHIKEHHEEVRERPCPHPGCNKVFMIDRYLQRHVKLIHTEVRNYICDECGQTFKQRKHLLVHQMRHSGAKPLQCEVCGFQCRQRASLKYHMTKHKAETELDFACDQCGRRFEKAHNLNVHMSMVHPLTQTQDKALPLEAEPPPGPPSPSVTTEDQAVKPEPT